MARDAGLWLGMQGYGKGCRAMARDVGLGLGLCWQQLLNLRRP